VTKASDNAFPSVLITEGTEPSAPAAGKQRLYIDSTTHKLKRTDSSGTDVTIESTAGTAGTALLLDYAHAADISNQATVSNTPYDIISNQNFTVAGGTGSVIEVCVRGFGFFVDAVDQQIYTTIVIDSAGTPVTKLLTAVENTNTSTVDRINFLQGGSYYLTGLAAAVHTVKLTVTTVGGANHFYCRANTGPAEFLHVQIIEHKN
jgi:hypothetical protein